jgi:hypothetical protein
VLSIVSKITMTKREMTRNLTTLLIVEILKKSPFRRRAHKRLDHSEDLEVDGMIILKCILNMLRDTDWILKGQDRDKWLDLVKTAMKFRGA